MSKKRVLIVTQEMEPYTALSEISQVVSQLPKQIMKNGMEIRILMPRYGIINERRHRLHEVVRLSGMNIIVNEDDYPLIIKVASLPQARTQVYFLDNDDFFKRKAIFEQDGKAFEDNEDRMIFFCKGVLETVKKFGWPPDIIHCHGWMTSLIPAYLKTVYNNEPLFQDSNVIYSAYNNTYSDSFSKQFIEKASINDMQEEHISVFQDGENINLHKGAIHYADAIIQGSKTMDEGIVDVVENLDKPFLNFHGEETQLADYMEFYNNLLIENVE